VINGIEVVGRVLLTVLISTAFMLYLYGIEIDRQHVVHYNKCLQNDTDTSCSLRWGQEPMEKYYWEQGME
jgi:hypothetical protein